MVTETLDRRTVVLLFVNHYACASEVWEISICPELGHIPVKGSFDDRDGVPCYVQRYQFQTRDAAESFTEKVMVDYASPYMSKMFVSARMN